jgi:small subunit ribosomal protein S19
MKKVAALNNTGKKSVIKTWARASVIHPDFVGHTFGVHNGKSTYTSVCHRRYGRSPSWRISPTRKFIKHAGKA